MKITMEEVIHRVRRLKLPPFRRNFVTGFLTLAPVLITFYVIWLIVGTIGGKLASFLSHFPILGWIPDFILTFVSLLILVGIIYLVGVFSSSVIGAEILKYGETFIEKIPLIRSVYIGSKQLMNTFSTPGHSFTRAVLVDFPYHGSHAIGFVTNSRKWRSGGKVYINVFIPTTPNPTSGWYIIVEEDRVKYLDMSIEDAVKMVVSGGLVIPPGGSGIIENAMDKRDFLQNKG